MIIKLNDDDSRLLHRVLLEGAWARKHCPPLASGPRPSLDSGIPSRHPPARNGASKRPVITGRALFFLFNGRKADAVAAGHTTGLP